MKPNLLIALVVMLLATGCGPGRYLPYDDLTPESTIVRIECRNDEQLQQRVIQILRYARITDLSVHKAGSTEDISARYSPLPDDKAFFIKEELRQMPGVYQVDIRKDPKPIGQYRRSQ